MQRGGADSCPTSAASDGTEPRAEGTGVGDERDRPRRQRTSYSDLREQYVR